MQIKTSENTENIINKLYLAQCDVEPMQKDGKNEFHKYKYISEKQVTLKFNEIFKKHKILFIHSSVVDESIVYGDRILTNISGLYRFIDVESKEWLEASFSGQGSDGGDKGLYKAITGGLKYVLMKNFLIPTGDDPEADKKTDQLQPTQGQPKSSGQKTWYKKVCPICKIQFNTSYKNAQTCYNCKDK